MASAPSDRDESATESEKAPSLFHRLLALLSRVPLPSLGSERHEMVLDAAPAEGIGAEPAAPPAPTQAPAKRAPGRFPFLSMKRETRVGIAALVSFLFLVTALATKKGWIGKPITMALAAPEGGPDSPESTPPPPESTASTKAEPKPVRAEEKEASPAKKDPKRPRPGPATKVVDEVKPPAPIPDEPPSSKLTLAGDPPAAEPAAPPPSGAEPSNPATLADTAPTFPTTLPADLPPPTETPPSAPLPAIGETPPSSPPAFPAPSEPPPTTPAESPATEPGPSPGGGLPLIDEPPPMKAAETEKPQAPPDLAEMTREPTPSPAPTPTPKPAPPPSAASAPVLAEQPPKLDPVPAGTMESAATKTSAVGAIGPVAAAGAGWVVIQSGGRRIVGASPIVSTPSDEQADSPPRVVDGPRVADDLAAADQVEPVVHVVRAGENFWTISRIYYRSGRFYRALHAANRRQVPKIDELYVGTVLRIPPPEVLDRTLIDPPGPTTTPVSRTSKRADPGENVDLAMPAVRPRMIRPDPEAVEAPRRPTYTSKVHETLRSIARDTLSDPRRDREIYNLNRDILDNINVLEPGTTLTLPEDAIVGRRSR